MSAAKTARPAKSNAKPKPGADDPELAAPPDVAAAPTDATVTKSGLAYKNQKKGTGSENPGPTDTVKVNYIGWTPEGEMFDASKLHGGPAEFPLNQVIKGWTEAVQLMVIGDKTRFWIPGKIAYGDGPRRPNGPPTGPLVFDVELLEIVAKGPKPIPAPEDVAAPPKDAKKTDSGLAYKVLKPGTGKTHPTPENKVKVHYTGWKADGEMFDSSVMRGEPTSFGVKEVIKGWTEGLQLMVVGEQTRFWIPADLAYGENPKGGRPGGQLTFDVELIQIT